ncbi:hypothetical protein MMC16_007475 [Acarospora aff. strigata]|nr:hypothetical protein [Acarospora aff. strigata]
MSEPQIPPRRSSRAAVNEVARKARLEAVKRKRKLHQSSQESLNCLSGISWYDEEMKIIELEQVALTIKTEGLEERMRQAEEGTGDGSTVNDRLKMHRDIIRQELALEDRKASASKYRQQLKDFSQRILRTGKQDLHRERVKFARFVASLLNQDFGGFGACPWKQQQAFQKELIMKYRCESEDKEHFWDPILHRWVDKDEGFTAAHLFPYRLGRKCMEEVFGEESANDLFSYRNGLMLPSWFERKLDKGLVVIVPKGELSERCWRIKVLDKLIFNEERPVSWAKLDNRELEFRSDTRPAARYLYFLYAIAILKMTKKGKRAWQDDHGQYIWATQGRYIRKNVLISLGEATGHKDPTDIADLADHMITDGEEEDEMSTDEKISGRILAEGFVRDGLLEEDEEDDDDEDDDENDGGDEKGEEEYH